MDTTTNPNFRTSRRWPLIDRFLPADLYHFDHREQLYKARALVVAHLINLCLTAGFIVVLDGRRPLLQHLWPIIPVVMIAALIQLWNLLLFRRNGAFALAANGYALTSIAALLCAQLMTGGFYLSPAMPWWPIIITYTFIMGGWLVALPWAVIGLLILAGITQLDAGWFINIHPPDTLQSTYTGSVVLCGFFMMAALGFVEFCQRQLLGRVQKERDRALFSAAHDPLTGLANRNEFQNCISHAAEKQTLTGGSAALLLLDLDGFKQVNDDIGHGAGDQVLVTVAQRIREHTRRTDCAARLGGDEFAVLLCDLPEDQYASIIARKLHDAITAPITLDNHRVITVGASIGIAFSPGETNSIDELLHHADQAMYAAKSTGADYRLYAERDAMRY